MGTMIETKTENTCERCGGIFIEVRGCSCPSEFHYEGGNLEVIGKGVAKNRVYGLQKKEGKTDIRHDSIPIYLCDKCLEDFWEKFMCEGESKSE